MLIINGDITKPKTEQQVVEWLANYVTHPGIAVSGVYVPRLDGGSTEAGLLVFTPHAVAVIEVDVLRKKARGPLSCSMNERWSAPGIHGDPVQLRGDALNPLHQVRRPVSALRTFVAELTRGPEPFVDGLILLMPKSGNTLTLDKGPMPGGFTVLLGDSASQLYSWFGRTAQHRDRTPWTAELVVTVLTALRVDRTRDAESRRRLYADLVAEGFPTEVPAARKLEDPDPAASSAAPSGAPTAQPDPAGQTEPNSQADPASSHIRPAQDESAPAAPSTPAYISTPSGTPDAQPEIAGQVEANSQAVPTGSPIPPARTDSISAAPPAPAPVSSVPPTSSAGPISSTSPVPSAKPHPSTSSTSHAEPHPSTASAAHAEPTPSSTRASQPFPNDPAAAAPAATTHPSNSAPLPSSGPPRRSAEPIPAPFPSGTTAHTAPITSPQADAPEPNWHEPAPDVDPRTQPPANHRLRTALLGIAAALILVCGIGYMAGKDHPRAQPGSQPAPSQVHPPERTTTPIPTSPVAPTDRQGTSPRSATPTEGATCYPFQAGC
ncbi:nuclease-related domain-containing protein [Nocardia sp. MDA0666]|uniref:nuclease-related domain-containing protein n=1 Tax=Nocardia sp. MDA0666 TaxID=2135448 RepID=UPI000D137EBB|nr:nuclease-related domain-containing protein [Nocardia sp. MDA0666]